MGMYGEVENKSRWDYSLFREHPKVYADIYGESRTRQEFAAECNVNTIMARYKKTGVFPMDQRKLQYVDFGDVPDLQSAMNTLIDAERAFMSLPAKVRRDFDNSPIEFVKFAEDRENLPKLREWGLAEPEKPLEAPMRVEVVNPPPAPPEA